MLTHALTRISHMRHWRCKNLHDSLRRYPVQLHADHWSASDFYADRELAAWHAEESFLGLDKLGGDSDDAMLEDETDSTGISDCSMSCDDLRLPTDLNTVTTSAAQANTTDSCGGTRFEQQVPGTHEQQNEPPPLVANVELGLHGTHDENDFVDPDTALPDVHAGLGAPSALPDDMDILFENYAKDLVGGGVEGWSVASAATHMVAVLDVEDSGCMEFSTARATYMVPSYHLVPVLDHHHERSRLHTSIPQDS